LERIACPWKGVWIVPIALLLVSAVACGEDSEAEGGGTPTRTTAQATVPVATDVEQAIARASTGLPNVRWDGENEPSVIRFEEIPGDYTHTIVADGLLRPTNLTMTPDGRILVTEQHTGHVRVISADGVLQDDPFATLPNPARKTELGTIGITVHPDFPNPAWVYVFHVAEDEHGEVDAARVYRFTDRDGEGTDETVLMELPATTSDKHNGGNMRFGPDGRLYISIGDLDTQDEAQSIENLAGTIIRVNDDGSTPEDNPFVGIEGADPRIFAYGLRNTYGFDWHPGLGAWIGADNAVTAFDEINIIEPGGNYGWPAQRGYYLFRPELEDIRFPVQVYLLAGGVSGLAVYDRDEMPEFQGDVFMCHFHRGATLHRIRFDDDGRVVSNTVIANRCSGDIIAGTDGALYFVGIVAGSVSRIGPE
jgi:aldose sugar dehydrogenase